ncbi:MBL fold metallo-hydrolase [Iamia sp. SCSIO 61187]|uniref:MBL fold metallo-hydrolase n=1 Tax=Iamia sp. SCSIO 61187 TaxID=2722752 RepID=UPI00351D1AE0|nr:MBL fold metallo-hydrolase [Iamia sp. SCSIO 61187]
MTQIGTDLWETRADSPFPGLTTHGYLWVRPEGNVLLYSVLTDADFDAVAELGGVAHQYLSHVDEAGPMLGRIAERFGSTLHAPAAEADDIGRHARPGVVLDRRHRDDNGIEVVPTPGHTRGSTSYLLTGADGTRYLFVGDTAYRGADGRWRAGYLGGISDAARLRHSLGVLAALDPDVVVSSAFAGDGGAHPVTGSQWRAIVDEARRSLPEG